MTNVAFVSTRFNTVVDLFHQFFTPVEYVTITVTFAVLLLGTYIGYQSYRGYKRNDNRPILYLGLGLFLVTTGRQLASLLAYFVVGEHPLLGVTVFFGLSITGLLSVLYAFLWA